MYLCVYQSKMNKPAFIYNYNDMLSPHESTESSLKTFQKLFMKRTNAHNLKEFLKERKALKISVIAESIGWNVNSMNGWLGDDRPIPTIHEAKLTQYLVNYGYPPDKILQKLDQLHQHMEKLTAEVYQTINGMKTE